MNSLQIEKEPFFDIEFFNWLVGLFFLIGIFGLPIVGILESVKLLIVFGIIFVVTPFVIRTFSYIRMLLKIKEQQLEPIKDQFYLEAENEVEKLLNSDLQQNLEKQEEKKEVIVKSDEEILEEIYNSEKKLIDEFLEEINGNKVISFDMKPDVKYSGDVDWYEFRTTTKSVRYALGYWYRVSRDYGRAGTEFKSNSELIKLSAKGNKYFYENIISKTEYLLKQARISKYNYDALSRYKREQNETTTS